MSRGTNAGMVNKTLSPTKMKSTALVSPQQLPESHAALAASFGVPHAQIKIVSNNEELRKLAREFGDPKEHSDSVIGLCLRAEIGDDFPDPQIVLVWPVPESVHIHAYGRLERLGASHTLNYRDANKSDWLLAFLLLHEIAHYQLNHGPNGDEDEADLWAHAELVKRYGTFARAGAAAPVSDFVLS
jgi:hypothetical protein